MRGWNFETSLKKTCVAKLKFLKVLSCILKARLAYGFRAFICCFLKSETFINFSIYDQQDFVKTREFGRLGRHYNVMMTSHVN